MKRKYLLLILIPFFSILLYYLFGFLHGQKEYAVVTQVVDKPNIAEDGFYGISVTDFATNQKYFINATGYLNTPMMPSQQGEACVNVPKVTVGQKIQFNLPIASRRYDVSADKIYESCYKMTDPQAPSYFFTVVSD